MAEINRNDRRAGRLEKIVMRDAIWKAAVARHREGQRLPWYLLVLRASLYPIDFLRWQLDKASGYNPWSDVWHIHGVRFSGRALLDLANSAGEIYRIARDGDLVTLERFPHISKAGKL